MPPTWELNVKPSFLTDLLALPNKKVARQVQQGVEALQNDPRPDGHVRKKLKCHQEPVYRLRTGDFRVIYTFGKGWVRLLAVKKHHEGYDDESIGFEKPAAVPPADDGEPNLPAPVNFSVALVTSSPLSPVRPLPRPVTCELLAQLEVPAAHHRALLNCTDEDGLLDADVPLDVRLRLVDALFPTTVKEVLQQPDLAVPSSDALARFADGEIDLKDFLLRLDHEQERAVDWGTTGPLLVKGGPGVGKSVTLLFRVRTLLTQARQEGRPPPRVLLTTYTNALCRFSYQLLARLLLRADLRQVTIQTADKLAYAIAKRHGQLLCRIADGKLLREIVTDVRKWAAVGEGRKVPMPPDRLRDAYLLDEFAWVIEGRGVTNINAYLAADRTGRGI